jgi:tRNA-2-methylthio-N6-dimethylallyladenosine synthase
LPEFIDVAFSGGKGIGVKLSRTETYDDIIPYREDGLSAWISVMRGCDKFVLIVLFHTHAGANVAARLIRL